MYLYLPYSFFNKKFFLQSFDEIKNIKKFKISQFLKVTLIKTLYSKIIICVASKFFIHYLLCIPLIFIAQIFHCHRNSLTHLYFFISQHVLNSVTLTFMKEEISNNTVIQKRKHIQNILG